MGMLSPRARWRGYNVVTLLVALLAALLWPAGAASAAVVAAKGQNLKVTALDVAPKSVKPGLGQAVVAVTWTIADHATAATTVSGDLYIRMRGSTAGTYIGMAYDIPFVLGGVDGNNGATWLSGTAADSSYKYLFPVPVYANKADARWTVTEIDAKDDAGDSLAATGSALAFNNTVSTVAQVDSTPPGEPGVTRTSQTGGSGPVYIYDAQNPAVITYQISVNDNQSGFWKGTLLLDGPAGQTRALDFQYLDNSTPGSAPCSLDYYQSQGPAISAQCTVSVTFPAGTVGTWTIASVTAVDNAGNSATYPQTAYPQPVTLTDDSTLSASGFGVSPNNLNTWMQDQTTELTFSASGVRQGLTSAVVDGGFYGCTQQTQVPTLNPDGTYSVPITMPAWPQPDTCAITGLVLVDGAGDVALYGSDYSAPDLGVTINRIPDTIAPTVTAASLSPATISVNSYDLVEVVATVSAPIAPVEDYVTTVYDANGNPTSAGATGGVGPVPDGGTATLFIADANYLTPGTYTVGFTITDAGGLSTSYGGPGQPPVPGGPLILTVTAS